MKVKPGTSHAGSRDGAIGETMIIWSGRILAFLGATHFTLGTLVSARYFGDWLSLRLWEDFKITELPPGVGAFFFGPASFGLPLLLIGLLVIWMGRRSIVPPAFLAWTLLAWSVVCTVIAVKAPWELATIAAVMLLVASRRARLAGAATPSPDRGHHTAARPASDNGDHEAPHVEDLRDAAP